MSTKQREFVIQIVVSVDADTMASLNLGKEAVAEAVTQFLMDLQGFNLLEKAAFNGNHGVHDAYFTDVGGIIEVVPDEDGSVFA